MMKIALTRGKFAVVDACDYDRFSQYKWHYDPKGYAMRNVRAVVGRRISYMHREIIAAPNGVEVDHINGDGLDNRRSNIRLVTRQQNQFNRAKCKNNTSGFKGVTREGSKWRARIIYNNKFNHLGLFSASEDAARAYDVAALKYYGEFARLNFKEGE